MKSKIFAHSKWMVLHIQSALLWGPPSNYCNYWLHKSRAAVGLSCKMWFISPLCVKWHPTPFSLAKPMEMKKYKEICQVMVLVLKQWEKSTKSSMCHQVRGLCAENKFSNLFKLGVTVFQWIVAVCKSGSCLDGNSCVGIDQGRYYQLLAKTAS